MSAIFYSWRDLKDITKLYFSVECRKFLRKIDSKRKFIKLNNSCNGEKTGEILIVNNDSNSQKNGSLHFNVGNNHHFFLSKRTFLHHPIQPGTVRNKSFRWFSWYYTHTRYLLCIYNVVLCKPCFSTPNRKCVIFSKRF